MKDSVEIMQWRPELNTAEWEVLDLTSLARMCDIHPDMVHRFVVLGIIEPVSQKPELEFDTSAVLRIRRTIRMRRDLGVNYASAGLILDLLDEMDALREKVRRLETQLERERS